MRPFRDDAQVLNANGTNDDGESGAGGDGDEGYQTLALVQDGNSGGYVLIVQPGQGQGSGQQVQLPASLAGSSIVTTSSSSGTQHITLNAESLGLSGAQGQVTVAISADGKLLTGDSIDADSLTKDDVHDRANNDISVYDFEEGHANANAGEVAGTSSLATGSTSIVSEVLNDSDATGTGGETADESTVDYSEKLRTRRSKKSNAGTPSSTSKRIKTSGTPGSNFSTPNNSMSQHMCNYCNYTSNKRYLLSRHMKSHSEDRPHKCGICERGFKTIASLNNHVNTHTGVRPHGCKYCDASFTTSGELVRHVRYRHTHEKPHRCNECDYASVELSKLKRHMRCHTGERPYQCPHCTYASPDTYKLKRHLRIHTGEKPYECDVCHARFTQSNSLKAHRLIHSGNKPVFKCDLCPTTCGRKTDLRIHVQKLHTAEKPLTCKRCDQAFPDRYSFKIHLKSHEGEKCFKCDLCNYASVSARHLESHMLIHTDQKPFICDECDQSFRQKQLLKRHKNLYHNPEYIPPQPKEKTHECPNCSKAFRHKGNLMRHLALHDPDAYKDSQLSMRTNDSHQLIDDEEEEDEDIMLSNSASQSMDESTLDAQSLQFTLDPQTQQMLSGEQVVVFEVVQLNNGESATGTTVVTSEAGGDGSSTQFAALDGTQLQLTTTKNSHGKSTLIATPAGNNKSGVRTLRLDTSQLKSGDNYIIQLADDDEDGTTIVEDDQTQHVVEEAAEFTLINSKTTAGQSQQLAPPPLVLNEDNNKQVREQLQKQKDFSDCFGFKDDSDEDEAILSMPAAHAQ
jgi:uncharacterized Zn-finger protein